MSLTLDPETFIKAIKVDLVTANNLFDYLPEPAAEPSPPRQLVDWPLISSMTHWLLITRYAASGAPAEIRRIYDERTQRYVPPPPPPRRPPTSRRKGPR